MKQIRPVRVIKQGQRQRAESPAEALPAVECEPSERELKSVVAGWIREHRQRSEAYRRSLTDLLKESGLPGQREPKLA